MLLADVLHRTGTFAGQSTAQVTYQSGTVDESNHSTLLSAWHPRGKSVTTTMFDRHGEKASLTAAAGAISNPR